MERVSTALAMACTCAVGRFWTLPSRRLAGREDPRPSRDVGAAQVGENMWWPRRKETRVERGRMWLSGVG